MNEKNGPKTDFSWFPLFFFLVRNGEICCNLIDLPLIGERHEVRVNAIVD